MRCQRGLSNGQQTHIKVAKDVTEELSRLGGQGPTEAQQTRRQLLPRCCKALADEREHQLCLKLLVQPCWCLVGYCCLWLAGRI